MFNETVLTLGVGKSRTINVISLNINISQIRIHKNSRSVVYFARALYLINNGKLVLLVLGHVIPILSWASQMIFLGMMTVLQIKVALYCSCIALQFPWMRSVTVGGRGRSAKTQRRESLVSFRARFSPILS